MRIGIIVDGQAEYRSLASLCSRIKTASVILNPLYADIQPHANPAKIVRASLPAVKVLARRAVDRIVFCIDHETRQQCIPSWRLQLENSLADHCAQEGVGDVRVVMKAQMFENWLVADVDALKKKNGRFNFTQAHENRIVPNKADSVDAVRILKSAAVKSPYHKINDAVTLMSTFDPYKGAANSRSLRRLLRLLGCELYSEQSKIPLLK